MRISEGAYGTLLISGLVLFVLGVTFDMLYNMELASGYLFLMGIVLGLMLGVEPKDEKR